MTIQELLAETSKQIIPIATLTSLAADRAAFGDDVIAAFKTQIEQRSTQASTVLETATAAGRDTLLASEQRSYDAAIRERDSILALQQAVERRTEQRAHVPLTQVETRTQTTTDSESPVLGKEVRCVDWLQKRGKPYVYAGEQGIDRLSFGRVLRGVITGNRQGLTPLEQRVMSEGSGPSGQYAVPEVLGAQIIDAVRNRMVLMRAGAQVVPMTSETLAIARVASGPDIAWKSENQAITPSDLVLERVLFTARTLPVLLKMSVELSEDAQNLDAAIERAMSTALATELDRVGLVGSGTPPEPEGILNQSGVTVTPGGGTTPDDYDFIVDAIGDVWANNHEPNAIITNAGLATTIAKFKETTNNQPLGEPAVVAALPKFRTNNIPSGSPASSALFVGDFTQLLIGMRTSFTLEVSRQAADSDGSAFRNMQVWIRAYLRADIQLAHPEAFAVVDNVGEE